MILFKADYKKYSVPQLERLRFKEEDFYRRYNHCVLLQTCNRVEVYFDPHVENLEDLKEDFKDFELIEGDRAIIHLLRLAGGLESMIVGEDQILGQIKKSYHSAKKYGKTTKYLDTVFLKSIHIGQRVRSETRINKGRVSIASAAIELLEKTVGLKNKNILVIGAGEIGTLVAKVLIEKNIRAIFVANRTYKRAERLAEKLGGMAVHFDKLKEALNFCDVIICATASPHKILDKEILKDVKGEKIIVDIANPRDVDDNVKELPNIKLYTIDHLTLVSQENLERRKMEIPAVERIIEEEFTILQKKLEKLNLEYLIRDYRGYIEGIRTRELEKALKKIKHGKDPEEVLVKFSQVFANRLLHDFIDVIYSDHIDREVLKKMIAQLKKKSRENH
ncbi:MAG TPA: glutamyl-tRNA reductase [Methanothermococcus okinawensis]|uniref:Glutamyl-tRNA reductase n=1 Tax=Methanothermococcus okinawensis TaxID=155863 RepID=A0A833E446_9EURY|nr:glutamyl-tRNA reductase [Methanococcaceae archaeon]HIP84643.1 glutamyl-tRNA reductase [Methanothermococcus okinawensis]HIP91387.1 glutamyl-tRNA reductase [Methanothermococcus okinawensis]